MEFKPLKFSRIITIGIFLIFFTMNQIGLQYNMRWLATFGAVLIGGWLALNLK